MQELEVLDYVNERPRRQQKRSKGTNQTGRRVRQLLLLSVGLLCIEPTGCVSALQCPENWRKVNSRCYFLSTEEKTWEDSRRDCQSRGADLVVIDSEQEQRALYQLDGTNYLVFWIGLSDTTGTNQWTWVDGSALTNPFWKSGQPGDGGPNNVEDCVEMYHHDPVLANWNDARCGDNRRWLCEKAECAEPTVQCPQNWKEFNSRCYFLSTEEKTWEDSRRDCQSRGADLVVIDSEQEQKALYQLDGTNYLVFWIGLSDTTGTNQWTWVDGSALTNPFWKSGQPGDGGPNNVEDCVEMYHHDPVLANWNDARCGDNRRWLCEKAKCAL